MERISFKERIRDYFGSDIPIETRLSNMLFSGGTLMCIVCIAGGAVAGMSLRAVLICVSLACYMCVTFFISIKTKRKVLITKISLILINFFFFPLIFLTTGGVEGGIISYFVLGVIFSYLIFSGLWCFVITTAEIIFYSFVVHASYKWDHITASVASKEYTYLLTSTIVVVSALVTGLIVRVIMMQYRKEKKKIDNAVRELEYLATKDPLTGVFNRRYMLDFLQSNINRAYNYGAQLSVVIFDIDRFKSLNDDYGHIVGDEILASLCKEVSTKLRTNDIFSRYGGEEFVAVFPNTSAEIAYRRAEEIRKIVEESVLSKSVERIITISGGVAEYSKGMSIEELIDAADKNLYIAKTTGRNKICASHEYDFIEK